MEKFFNTAGPNRNDLHYTIDPLTRLNWDEIYPLILQQKYFLLYAPRQTGKTSTLLAMMHKLNSEGRFNALYVNIESAQAARNDANSAVNLICDVLTTSADIYLKNTSLKSYWENRSVHLEAKGALYQLLTHWSETSDKPTVLMLDKVDALVGDSLITLLRQIRSGYAQRPQAFPQTIILCGVRDIQDYRIHTSNQEIITGGSVFNIKAESLRMGNFSQADVKELLLQHTLATGQSFTEEIFTRLWQDTEGQPWLVNAIAYQLTYEIKRLRDRAIPILLTDYQEAREDLIRSRATHLDQLADKLKEDRVKRVILPILEGEDSDMSLNPDDIQYVIDLGLINRRVGESISISNKIYQEIIPRELSWGSQMTLVTEPVAAFLHPNNQVNMEFLMTKFQQFYRENSEAWLTNLPYKEVAPQILLQAFLQRVINGGGRVNREYALGRKRTDLLVEWPLELEKSWRGKVQRIVIELKILRATLSKTLPVSLEQTVNYAKQVGADEAHLVLFNPSKKVSWNKKIWHKRHEYQGMTVDVWGA